MTKTRKFDGKTFTLRLSTQNKVNADSKAHTLRVNENRVRVTYDKVKGERVKYYRVWARSGRKTWYR